MTSVPEVEQSGWRQKTTLHMSLVIALLLCAVAFAFELARALSGNALSWAYVFEWPLLAVFLIYMWWRMRHPERETRERVATFSPQVDAMRIAWLESQHLQNSGLPATPETKENEA